MAETAEKNRAIAIRFIDTIANGDVATFDKIVAPDARFFILGRGWMDHDPYMTAVKNTILASTRREIRVIGSTAEGERVALELEGRFEFPDGKVYQNCYHHLFVIRDGIIVCVKEYMDTAATIAAFGERRGS